MHQVSLPYNKYGNYRKSRPLKNQSERTKYLCHIISMVIRENSDRSRTNQNAPSIFAIQQVWKLQEIQTTQKPIRTHQVSLLYNKYGNYRKSRPLKNQSERTMYLCHTIRMVITGNSDRSRTNQNAPSIFAIQ